MKFNEVVPRNEQIWSLEANTKNLRFENILNMNIVQLVFGTEESIKLQEQQSAVITNEELNFHTFIVVYRLECQCFYNKRLLLKNRAGN